jgi:TRAP-type C4-dicarboxylate transport system permease small subunit
MTHGVDAVVDIVGVAAPEPEPATFFDRILAHVNYMIVILASMALVAASCVLSYSVATRYFLHWSTDWQDEMSVFLIVGAVFMSAAAVQARRGHVAIEAIVGLLSPKVNRTRLLLVDIATLAFCGYFAWKSALLLHEAIVDGYRSSSTWQPPLWIPYSLMTVGMVLLSLQVALQIVAQLRPRRSAA